MKKNTIKMKSTRRQSAAQTAQPKAVPAIPASLSATLSDEASALVRWYCAITHHREEAAVEGAVYGALTRAREAYEQTPGFDEAFDWLLEDVLDGMQSVGRQPRGLQFGGGYTVQLDGPASMLLRRFVEEKEADMRDVVSAAVAYALEAAFDPGQTAGGDYRRGEFFRWFAGTVGKALARRETLESVRPRGSAGGVRLDGGKEAAR